MFQAPRTSSLLQCCILSIALFSHLACSSDLESGDDFSLPQGSAQAGRQAFIDLQCTACHTVAGVELPDAEEMLDVSVVLGTTTLSKTEPALVTALINPSHSLIEGLPLQSIYSEGKSKMAIFNDVMTVTQLIDIVTFLKDSSK